MAAKKKRNQLLNKERKVNRLSARVSLLEHTFNLEKKLQVAMKENSLLKMIGNVQIRLYVYVCYP